MKKALLRLYPWELASLPEYSTSLPTGTTIGKFWKCNTNRHGISPTWVVCAYDEHPDPKLVAIHTFDVAVLDGPQPRGYYPPDWTNYARWKQDRDVVRAEGGTR